MYKIWCEKYLYFGTSLYDQDEHWYFGKNSCCDSKFFARNTVGFMWITETYEESIYTKMAFI